MANILFRIELKFSQIEVKFECLDMHLRLVCTLDFGTPTTFFRFETYDLY